MDLQVALGIYLIIVIAILVALIRKNINVFSAIMVSLLSGLIILNFMTPLYTINPWGCLNSSTALYYAIQIGTVIISVVYIYSKGLRDFKY